MLIFLLIFCFVLLIALTNIYISAIFDIKGFYGFIRIFGFKISFPKDKDRKKAKSKSNKTDVNDKQRGKLNELKMIIEPAFCALGKFVHYLCIRKLYMDICVGTGDAFSTAMLYGEIAAGIGSIFPILNQNLKIKKKCINVVADFGASESTVYMEVVLSLRVWKVLVVAYIFAIKYLKKLINKRKDDQNGRTRIK